MKVTKLTLAENEVKYNNLENSTRIQIRKDERENAIVTQKNNSLKKQHNFINKHFQVDGHIMEIWYQF